MHWLGEKLSKNEPEDELRDYDPEPVAVTFGLDDIMLQMIMETFEGETWRDVSLAVDGAIGEMLMDRLGGKEAYYKLYFKVKDRLARHAERMSEKSNPGLSAENLEP